MIPISRSCVNKSITWIMQRNGLVVQIKAMTGFACEVHLLYLASKNRLNLGLGRELDQMEVDHITWNLVLSLPNSLPVPTEIRLIMTVSRKRNAPMSKSCKRSSPDWWKKINLELLQDFRRKEEWNLKSQAGGKMKMKKWLLELFQAESYLQMQPNL